MRSVLAVPLITQDEALGVVYLDDRARQGAFGERELAWVRLVASVAASAIADALAQREAELGQVRVELATSRAARATRFRYDDVIGESAAMRQLLRVVDR